MQPPYRQPEPLRIACPKCRQPTDSLKSSTMFSVLLFLWIGAWWRMKRVIACPGCLRMELLWSTLLNTVLANLLSPIVWIWHTVVFAQSFGHGHSPEVLGLVEMGSPGRAGPGGGGWVCPGCGERAPVRTTCDRCQQLMVPG